MNGSNIEVERAISEVRSGRPVYIEGGGRVVLVQSVEALEPDEVANIEAPAAAARLVLSAPRLRRLGIDRVGAGIVALPRIDPARVATLVFGTAAKIDAPVCAPAPLDLVALELMNLAALAPAAVVVPLSEPVAPWLRVAADNLAAYRDRSNLSLRIVGRAPVPLDGAADSEFVVFRGGEGMRDQVAIVVGKPDLAAPVLVRLHSACLTGDLFGSLKCDCGDQLRGTAKFMAQNGGGILLYLDQEGRGNGIANKIRAYALQSRGHDTYDADELLGFEADQRRFEFAAVMLRQLGVTQLRLMTNNPVKIAAMHSAGLDVVSDERVIGRFNAHNVRYLAAKRDRAGHLFHPGEFDATGRGKD
jgi:GTP cyclohydrolase II